MKWAEKLANIVAVISAIFLLCLAVAIVVLSVVGAAEMFSKLVLPWIKEIL